MNFETLIGGYVRQYSRHKMRFPRESVGTPLPPPDEDRQYLLYLHIPYCVVLCPFCSFHRVRYEQDAAKHYFDCLRREIALVSDRGFRFDELYVGGGTPTVAMDELIGTIELVRQRHTTAQSPTLQ